MGERYKKRRDRHRRMSVTVSPGVHRLDPLRRGSSSLSMNYLTTLGIIVADSESKNGKSRWTTSLQWHRPSPRERYKMHVTAGFLARLSARRLPILPTKRTTVASLRADRLETYSSGSAQDLHLFPSYSDERVSIGSPSLQRYVFSDLHLHFFLRRIRRLVCRAGGEEISFGAETINDESPTSVPTKYTIKGIKCTPWFGAHSKEFGRGKGQKLQRTPARSSLPRRR